MQQAKVVLVTGGAKGVGLGITEAFLASGATLIVCGREQPAVLPKGVEFVTTDVRDAAEVEALFALISV